MTKTSTIESIKTPLIKKSKIMVPTQIVVDAKTTKAPVPKTPKAEEVSDLEWMNWVQYAQARLQFLENKLSETNTKLEELKETNKSLQKRLLQG
jgi:TolA-binding protein